MEIVIKILKMGMVIRGLVSTLRKLVFLLENLASIHKEPKGRKASTTQMLPIHIALELDM